MSTSEQLAYVDIPCSKCGEGYTEFRAVDEWRHHHPVKAQVCISCDPMAEQPALVAVTTKGRNALLVEPEQ